MNLEKTSQIIKKINRLYELINGIGEASQTEKDLLKAYTLDLYEAVVLHQEDEVIEDATEEEVLEDLKKKKKLEKKLKKQIKKKKEEIEEDLEDDMDEVAYEEDIEEVEEEPQEEEEASDEENQNGSFHFPEELEELFSISNSPELSDKLANSPIKDLTKAMGINEKIFTVNELFDGNQTEMDNMMLALNGLDNFDEAKSLLVRSVATKYNWSEASRKKKAKNFVRLVRRRYL